MYVNVKDEPMPQVDAAGFDEDAAPPDSGDHEDASGDEDDPAGEDEAGYGYGV